MQAPRFWKPGQARPASDQRASTASPRRSRNSRGGTSPAGAAAAAIAAGSTAGRRGKSPSRQDLNPRKGKHAGRKHAERARNGGGRGSDSKKRRQKGDSSGASRDARIQKPVAVEGTSAATFGRGKTGTTGPSQGLLAMKFMQRRAKADQAQKQHQDKRDKLEQDFSSSYAKRLKSGTSAQTERPDEQDPALIVIGRRSFGGFNPIAEAAYTACIRDIATGERSGQPPNRSSAGDADDGVSDTEMADRLGKNVGERRR